MNYVMKHRKCLKTSPRVIPKKMQVISGSAHHVKNM